MNLFENLQKLNEVEEKNNNNTFPLNKIKESNNDDKSIILSIYAEFDNGIDYKDMSEDEYDEACKSATIDYVTEQCDELLNNIPNVKFILGSRSDNMYCFPVKFIGPIDQLVSLIKVWGESAGDFEELMDDDYEYDDKKIIDIINNDGIIDMFNVHRDDFKFHKDVISPLKNA